MTSGHRGAHRSRSHRSVLIAAVVVAALAVAGIAWAVLPSRDGTSRHAVQGSPSKKPASTPATTKKNKNAPARADQPGGAGSRIPKQVTEDLRACKAAADNATAAARGARVAVGDWAAHIQAMKDEQSGKNTEAQTKAIWTRTRLAGPGHVSAFTAADQAFRPAREACTKVDTAPLTARQKASVEVCRTYTDEADKAVGAARASVAEWKAHLRAMADRRAGRLDSGVAMHKWMSAYEKAPFRISAYKRADQDLRQVKPCRLD
ncbi:hypothetical protein SAMN05421678_11220 [Actinopolymorpha cephalotaxi]|uniref:Uncharacterized protein n=1 Tax=Actinopolymorpha cephalotaxi TaxID=504797 RepID=A0A1I2X6C0_9ACTN|nr:hypothetical protein [Actinopolymorpha cephalotaxi]NYH86083.1 hypothetical protein [Actinopolymorpha cephalotaxi]SFH09058.1 hypothetical protein SAMN05421678_11220 [Actinopolymorpha cephalotaxi]